MIRPQCLSNNSMEKIVRTGCNMFQKIGKNQNIDKAWEICGKDDILTVKYKPIVLIENTKKSALK